ncbi:AAA family ATPase [uncultured Bacteroides sp.]|uniref:ATP-binding protein n=1 Tax=uncultured Bacteroides sp. TaxID=162156 RepID=UPI0025ED2F12|nr:AAA family ATPase [uncultured Bacteroides sp.]
MFRRDIYKKMQEWAERKGRKPLVLRGARQVGKTTVVNEFAQQFENYLHLNLEREEDARLFLSTDKVQEIVKIACFQKNILLREGRTLLFIDEIQNVPKAVALLRYFYEDMPELYVIAAGSRLQSLLKERISFPVGRVEYMQLAPCTFGEYLTAMGDEQYRTAIDKVNLPSVLHEEAMSRFHRYALIGGMPEVVADYVVNGDLVRLKSIYNSLLKGYNEDVEKYAPTQLQTQVIRHILKTGWNKAGQTIKLGNFGESNYNSKDVREAFGIMEKTFILNLVYPITAVSAPALPALKRAPKLMWLDTGLVNFAANIQTEFLHDRTLMDTWQGAVAEHIVGQQLRVLLDDLYISDLYFWVRDKQGSNAETDFVWQNGTQIIPIEVKCGNNVHLRSLHSFIDLSGGNLAIRIWNGGYSVDDVKTASGRVFRLINLPFYYVGSLQRVLELNL